jgi:hypothetical protein
VKQAIFSVGNYLEPLADITLQVYGFASDSAALNPAERNNGVLIGTLALPDPFVFGCGDLDVTSFVNQALHSGHTPYLDFSLRIDGIDDNRSDDSFFSDDFNSLENNYGRPAQLTITAAVPEPLQAVLLLAGLVVIGCAAHGRRRARRA